MNTNVLHAIEKTNCKVIIFDIDGTLKDLCLEHENALQHTLDEYNVGKFRRKLVLVLNKIAMSMVKTGMFSTNQTKQNVLIWMFSVLSGVKARKFNEEYFKQYSNQICLFEGAYELLEAINGKKIVYFSTINNQNYNLEECGIPQERILYTVGALKIATYKKLVESIGVNKSEVLIVGDNLFDDLLSAKLLGVKCLLVNNYNSKLKNVFCKRVKSKYLK